MFVTSVVCLAGFQVLTAAPATAFVDDFCTDDAYTRCLEGVDGGGDMPPMPPMDPDDPDTCCDETRPDYEANWQAEVHAHDPPPKDTSQTWFLPVCDRILGCSSDGRDDIYGGFYERMRHLVEQCRFGLSPDCDSFCMDNLVLCRANRELEDENRELELGHERDMQQAAERREEEEVREYCRKHRRDPDCRAFSKSQHRAKHSRPSRG